jgi:hypothetical protein
MISSRMISFQSEGLGKYKCDTRMSVENVSTVVDIKILKGRFVVHKFSTGWSVGVVKITGYTNTGYFFFLYKSKHLSTINKQCVPISTLDHFSGLRFVNVNVNMMILL